jgi:glutamate/tyrosine decarboxylase-like PLP-dependent enzyme
MAEPVAEQVRQWRRLLASCPGLSERFRSRHAIALAGLAIHAPEAVVREAHRLACPDPRQAARLLLGRPDPPVRASTAAARVTGSARLAERAARLLAGHDVDSFLAAQPVLEQTAVPLHPSRRARRLAEPEDGSSLVAVVWPASSLPDRAHCREAVRELAKQVTGDGGFQFRVQDDVALVWPAASGDPWAVAENLGVTLEDELRFGGLSRDDRWRVLAALSRLRREMIDTGMVWQGFAPRNMFRRRDQIVLIDFEEVVDASEDPVRAAEKLWWHRVFFADCLLEQEANVLFAHDQHAPRADNEAKLPADEFERALLGVETVTWGQRRGLLARSAALEGRHRRPRLLRDGGLLFGHELGHFWGDFLPPADEVRIFRLLSARLPERLRVTCLEAFEAAMEADIIRTLRRSAESQEDDGRCPRTVALADALENAGSWKLAEARLAKAGWYEQLESDPARLVDELLFTLGCAVQDLDRDEPERYLVGSPHARASHTARLVATVETGMAFLHGDGRDDRFLRYAAPEAIRRRIGRPPPATGASFERVLSEVDTVIAGYSVSQGHPGYLAFPDSGNAVAALAGSTLSRLLNQNLIAVDRSAPAATFVEIQVTEWLRELVGYPSAPLSALRGVRDVAGLWTTGGHLSNHVAMLVALGARFPQVREHGLRALDTQPAVVMAGPIAHYSHSDAAFHLGLGWNAVLPVAARPTYNTDPTAVEAVLADPPAGTTPFMVVGVAGNCRTTGLDDLAALADVCERHGVWFHADACHGGSLIFHPQLRRQHLAGIERADSVSLDPHKGLFTPYPSSYVLFRDRGRLTYFSRHTQAVQEDGCWDLGLITPFLGSRGFESLATWMLLRHLGVAKLGSLVEARQALVRYLDRRLEETGLFVRLNNVDFYRLAFVFCPPQVRAMIDSLAPDHKARAARVVSEYTSTLNTMLYHDGRICFDEHTLKDLGDRVGLGETTGYTVMACCPGNPLLTQQHLDAAVDRLVATARTLIGSMLAAITGEDGPVPVPRVAGPAGWSDQQ